MITHALSIVVNELNSHLAVYGALPALPVQLGNIAEGIKTGTSGGIDRDVLCLSIVNVKEEATLRNVPTFVRDDAALKARYENPPVFLNLQILLVATHANYTSAWLMLSRAIRFFQFHSVFTPETVAPASITTNAPINVRDRLSEFKLIFDLRSPTMEEINHLWGTLGGKQYPFVLYTLRMLDLKFQGESSESGLITDVVANIVHKHSWAP